MAGSRLTVPENSIPFILNAPASATTSKKRVYEVPAYEFADAG